MTFTVSSKVLNEALVIVGRVINSKNSLPVLADIVLTANEDNTLTLKASDGENSMTKTIELVSHESPGTIAIDNKYLVEAVRNLPEDPISFTVDDEKHVVKVNYSLGTFSLPVDNADEYPTKQEMSDDSAHSFVIKEAELKDNISRTLFATAQDELRPVMNGIFFDITTESLNIVSSDGHQLVRNRLYAIIAENDEKKASFILPKKPASILKNILRNSTECIVTVTFNDRWASFVTDGFVLQCRIIEGRYPNYNSVIPPLYENAAVVEKAALIAALNRVTPFSNNSSNLIKFIISDNSIRLSTEDWETSKTALEVVACTYEGESITIGFKGMTFIELLKNIGDSNVNIYFKDASRPALVTPVDQGEEQEVLMLQMPMLITD
jgi:DNA polymerase-3 subunit beta